MSHPYNCFRVAVFPVHSWLSTEIGNAERDAGPFQPANRTLAMPDTDLTGVLLPNAS